jgi:hypothetical protein
LLALEEIGLERTGPVNEWRFAIVKVALIALKRTSLWFYQVYAALNVEEIKRSHKMTY